MNTRTPARFEVGEVRTIGDIKYVGVEFKRPMHDAPMRRVFNLHYGRPLDSPLPRGAFGAGCVMCPYNQCGHIVCPPEAGRIVPVAALPLLLLEGVIA